VEFSNGRKVANPQNLWNIYFTSSKYVDEFRKVYGEPDVIEIRKTFSSAKNAIDHERKVLKRLNVIHKDKWLNKTNNKSIFITDDIKEILSTKAKERFSGENGDFYREKSRIGAKNSNINKTKEFYSSMGKMGSNWHVTKSEDEYNSFKEKLSIHNSYNWEITTPEGIVISLSNLKQFCCDNNLSYSTMNRVGNGIYSQHKGYKCTRLL
jgi:hypothetical protein